MVNKLRDFRKCLKTALEALECYHENRSETGCITNKFKNVPKYYQLLN